MNMKQKGFISIFSVMVIMTILTLVAIGFSNITREAQRRSLDNQLNTQAFYAAESGVNDAKVAISKDPTYSKSSCTGQDVNNSFKYTLDPTLNTGYTCVLVSQATDIVYDSVPLTGAAGPKTIMIEASAPVSSFDVTLNNSDGTAPIPNNVSETYPNVLEPAGGAGGWGNKLGALRMDLVPVDGALDRTTLITRSYGFLLYPTSSINGFGVLGVGRGILNQAGLGFTKCQGAPTPTVSPCTLKVSLFDNDPVTGNKKFLIRLQSVYNSLKVNINNFKDAGGASINLKAGQKVVDVTGKANDVLRRIQVRVPVNGINISSPFGIESADSICKRLQIDGTNTTPDNADSACQTQN